MKKLINAVVIFGTLLAASPTTLLAGTAADVVITSITFARECTNSWNGCIYVDFEGSYTDAPTCYWAGAGYRMALDINDDPIGGGYQEHSKGILAALLAAQTSGKRVTLSGMGSCAIGGNVESIRVLTVHTD